MKGYASFKAAPSVAPQMRTGARFATAKKKVASVTKKKKKGKR